MNPIAESAGRLIDGHRPFVLATIINREGSAPRTAGTRMIISSGGHAVGTIGGGKLEARVVKAAAEVLSTRHARVISFDMTPSELAAADMICGGRVEVLLEFVDPLSPSAAVFKGWQAAWSAPESCLFLTELRLAGDRTEPIAHALVKKQRVVCGDLSLSAASVENLVREHGGASCLRAVACGGSWILIDPVLPAETVFLFGAGHVAQPTARLAAFVGFRVQVVDDRVEFANTERFPDAHGIRVVADFGAALSGLAIGRDAFVVILTRGHLHDQTVLLQALNTEAAYIGMIGSRRKRDHIFHALLKQGVSETDLKRVHSPIGIDIRAETPEEIALSIVSELVRARAQRRSR